MAPTSKKIFISWSGPETKPIANTWADLLRDMFDFVEPFVSTAINPGERGLDQIKEALADTQFGVFVTTRANQHAAWLNFEAGAISNQATDTSTAAGKVAPCLVDFVNDTDLTSPLRQFQYRTLNREGVLDILTTIAEANSVDVSRIVNRFELAWNAPDTGYNARFAAAIATVTAAAEQHNEPDQPAVPAVPAAGSRPAEDMFSEILAILRDLQRREASDSAKLRRVTTHRASAAGYTIATPRVSEKGSDARRSAAKLSREGEARLVLELSEFLTLLGDDVRFNDAEFGYRITEDDRLGVAMRFPVLPPRDHPRIRELAEKKAKTAGWDFVEVFGSTEVFGRGWLPIIA